MNKSDALARPTGENRAPRLFALMAFGVTLEVLLGIGELFVLPLSRNSGWDPRPGRYLYLPHAALGLLLFAGAVGVVVVTAEHSRPLRLAARLGTGALVVSGIGGMAAVFHATRLVGMAVMFVASIVACMAYLMPYLAQGARGAEDHSLEQR